MVPDLVSELTPSAEKNLYLKKKRKKYMKLKGKPFKLFWVLIEEMLA